MYGMIHGKQVYSGQQHCLSLQRPDAVQVAADGFGNSAMVRFSEKTARFATMSSHWGMAALRLGLFDAPVANQTDSKSVGHSFRPRLQLKEL